MKSYKYPILPQTCYTISKTMFVTMSIPSTSYNTNSTTYHTTFNLFPYTIY